MKKQQVKEAELVNQALLSAASQFTGKDAVNTFIQEVLTAGERQTIGRRLAIARLILEGNTYYEIREKLHISPNTFRNIRQWVGDELPAYNNVVINNNIKKLEKDEKRTKIISKRVDPLSFAALKQRYPMHFLLFNLADELLASKENKRDLKLNKSK